MPAYTLRDRITNTSSAVFIPGKQEGILSADSCSFFSGLAEGIEILTFKKAEDDDGFILRLREILGRSTACKLKCCIKEIKKACRCLVTEEIIEEISMADNIVPVNFNPFSVETIRLRFNNED
jgi:alpha-mannosidase